MEAECRWPSFILACDETERYRTSFQVSGGHLQGSTLMPSDKINPIGLLGLTGAIMEHEGDLAG
jgi:hypothetical protein